MPNSKAEKYFFIKLIATRKALIIIKEIQIRSVMSDSLRACNASPSMGFSRQEYWSVLPFPSPEDLPNPGIESGPPAL